MQKLWVAKFEASHTGCTEDILTGETNTDTTELTLQVKPGVTSWRYITVNNIYTVCLNYDTKVIGNANLNSHMMKNSEWGAVAYLTESVYGKNDEVWVNPNKNFITGQAGTGPSVRQSTTICGYTSQNGVEASTTGNVYGIYDMSGGAGECLAAYINNDHRVLTDYGSSLVNGEPKTKDVYTIGSSDTHELNYIANRGVYGDAIYETSSNSVDYYNSWRQDLSKFLGQSGAFITRGGYYDNSTNAGIYAFHIAAGHGVYGTDFALYGFRPVMIII